MDALGLNYPLDSRREEESGSRSYRERARVMLDREREELQKQKRALDTQTEELRQLLQKVKHEKSKQDSPSRRRTLQTSTPYNEQRTSTLWENRNSPPRRSISCDRRGGATTPWREEVNPREKVFYESLLPNEYSGETDFDEYYLQFDAVAQTLGWDEQRKAAVLFAKLTGKALTCATKCPDRQYQTIIQKLRARFSPKDEEMFVQKLEAYRKKTDQTWEDLSQEIENLTVKAYIGMPPVYRDKMAARSFVEAIEDPEIRRKLRAKHPQSLDSAVSAVRLIESDIQRENKWQQPGIGEKKKSDRSRAIEELEDRVAQLQIENEKLTTRMDEASRKFKPKPKRKKPRGPLICYMCRMPGHMQKDCPYAANMGMMPGFSQIRPPFCFGPPSPQTPLPFHPENVRGPSQAALALPPPRQ